MGEGVCLDCSNGIQANGKYFHFSDRLETHKMIQTVLRPSRSECFVDKVYFFDYYYLRFKTFLIMRSVMDLFLTA